MIIENQTILKSGVPNVNGLVYTPESVKAAVEALNESSRPMLGTVNQTSSFASRGVNLDEVGFEVKNLRFEDDKVFGDIKVLGLPYGKLLQDLIEQDVKLAYRPVGTGTIGEDNVVRDYKIDYFTVYDASQV